MDPALIRLLARRCFVEAAYFGTLNALRSPTAAAHMAAGVGCCGCTHPLATTQRIFEGEPVEEAELNIQGLRISAASELPYEGFFHLIQALRLDPVIAAPQELREIFDAVADDLVFVSRREIHRAPDSGRQYTLSAASLGAAVLLRRLTSTQRPLSRVPPYKLEHANEIIEQALSAREPAGNGWPARSR